VSLIQADARAIPLRDGCVQCCITSPPYFGLRDYGIAQQIGLESTPDAYVAALVAVFREVRSVLADDGVLWLNIGDSYAGSWGAQSRPNGNDVGSTLQGGSMLSARQILAHPKMTQTGSLKNTPGLKSKDLIGMPWRVAFALQADGWYLRSDIIWSKPNPCQRV
jgi:DNA modification methylase